MMNSPKITTFITFKDQAEEALTFYVSLFKNSKIMDVKRYPEKMPELGGKFLSATFLLNGYEFMVLNGGPSFSFTEGFSLFVQCDTQAEVDFYWEKLSENGGKEIACGWLTDKFGVSWQIIPKDFHKFLFNENPEIASKAMEAMFQMKKLDINVLKAAIEEN